MESKKRTRKSPRLVKLEKEKARLEAICASEAKLQVINEEMKMISNKRYECFVPECDQVFSDWWIWHDHMVECPHLDLERFTPQGLKYHNSRKRNLQKRRQAKADAKKAIRAKAYQQFLQDRQKAQELTALWLGEHGVSGKDLMYLDSIQKESKLFEQSQATIKPKAMGRPKKLISQCPSCGAVFSKPTQLATHKYRKCL